MSDPRMDGSKVGVWNLWNPRVNGFEGGCLESLEADGELARVVLGLGHALGQWIVPWPGLDDRELGVAIDQQ
jgi:hypothetical protein